MLKAARAFFGVLGEPAAGVRFRLEKRIPAGSGLGGGSSDAAAALLGLQSLWGRPLDARQLHGAGAAVGSDVPFFLEGGTAFATGRGERVERLDDMPSATVLVVVPAVEVSTAEVYGDWKGATAAGSRGEGGPSTLLPPPSRRGDAAAWVLGNDLEPVVRRLHPEVDRLLLALERAGSTGGGVRRPGFGQRRRRVRGRGGTRHPGRTGRNERACVPDTNAASASSRALHVVVTFCKMGRPVWGVAKW